MATPAAEAEPLLLVSVVCSCAAVLVVTASSVFLVASDGPKYFPGDPPGAEVALMVSMPGVIVTLLLFAGGLFVARGHQDQAIRRFRFSLGLMTAASVVLSMPVLWGIAQRNFGEWSGLKAKLIEAERMVNESGGGASQPLSEARFDEASKWLLANPLFHSFQKSKDPVQIKVMRRTSPYVGVDFGDGQKAIFDVRTMYCLYSD